MNKWTLEPKNLTQSEDINRHFESILNQMNDLKEFMEQNGGKNSLNQSAEGSHLQENVNFMHTLNEFFTYVQIPLKLKKQFANSELYVYSKQKPGRTAADGIRVLLHLDMDHLGPLDIYLDLHDNNLAAKFYLDHTDTMNLIHSNLFLLEDVLKSKGYSLNTEVLKREKAVNVVEDFLKADSQTASVTRYNFDLRA